MDIYFKNGVKMNLRIITKNHAADPEIGFFTKSILKSYGRATAMSSAWGLNSRKLNNTHAQLWDSPVKKGYRSSNISDFRRLLTVSKQRNSICQSNMAVSY